jgi:chondroitin 4-sulfotransferase 11
MISHNHRCIFVHIPKTAGTSIEKIFYGTNSKKGSDHRFLQEYPSQLINQYYKFCVVRNPWERVFSIFNYYRNGGNNYTPPNFKEEVKQTFRRLFISNYHTDFEISKLMPQDFNVFCDTFLREGKDFYGNRALYPQIDYISIDGKVAMDRIIRFENLNDDLLIAMNELNMSFKMEHHRKSVGSDSFKAHFNQNSIDLVANYYRAEIEMFGYSFS